jgi:DNA-binding transcriptional LysR family regulator
LGQAPTPARFGLTRVVAPAGSSALDFPTLKAKHVDLRQLQHFVAVAEDGSFTRAARRMNIVQSGISASIGGLERELGISLFSRSKQQVELTAAGRALLVEARRALSAVNAGRAAALAANESLTGRLSIGIARAVPRQLQLARVLQQFHLANPGVSISVIEAPTPAFDALRVGEIDFAIGAGHAPGGVTSVTLMQCMIVLACAKSHPLASRRSIGLRALDGESFIDLPRQWATQVFVARALADAGMKHRAEFEVSSLPLLLQLVEEGAGVALVPDMLAELPSNVAFVPLRPAIGPWELTVSFAGAQPKTPVAAAFLTLLLAGPTNRRRDSLAAHPAHAAHVAHAVVGYR